MECNRRIFVKGLGFAFLGLSTFLKACNRLGGDIHSKEEKMQTSRGAQTSAVPRKSIPPVDAAMPNRVETATFALG